MVSTEKSDSEYNVNQDVGDAVTDSKILAAHPKHSNHSSNTGIKYVGPHSLSIFPHFSSSSKLTRGNSGTGQYPIFSPPPFIRTNHSLVSVNSELSVTSQNTEKNICDPLRTPSESTTNDICDPNALHTSPAVGIVTPETISKYSFYEMREPMLQTNLQNVRVHPVTPNYGSIAKKKTSNSKFSPPYLSRKLLVHSDLSPSERESVMDSPRRNGNLDLDSCTPLTSTATSIRSDHDAVSSSRFRRNISHDIGGVLGENSRPSQTGTIFNSSIVDLGTKSPASEKDKNQLVPKDYKPPKFLQPKVPLPLAEVMKLKQSLDIGKHHFIGDDDNGTILSSTTVKVSNVQPSVSDTNMESSLLRNKPLIFRDISSEQNITDSPTAEIEKTKVDTEAKVTKEGGKTRLVRKSKEGASVHSSPKNSNSSLRSKISRIFFHRGSPSSINTLPPDDDPVEPAQICSNDKLESKLSQDTKRSPSKYECMDSVIQGRLDGVDLLSLGSAFLPRSSHDLSDITKILVADTLSNNNAGSTMPWPVIILDGLSLTGEDRWIVSVQKDLGSVRQYSMYSYLSQLYQKGPDLGSETNDVEGSSHAIEGTAKQCLNNTSISSSFPSLVDSKCSLADDSMQAPLHQVLTQMWGNESDAPATHHITPVSNGGNMSECMSTGREDKNNGFLIISSCPIDVDEDIFIVETSEHLKNIYEVTSEYLRNAMFDKALEVMRKAVRSLLIRFKVNEDGDDSYYVIGTAYYNLGLVQMWNRRYKEAVVSFKSAVRIRNSCRQMNVAPLVVSLSKLGVVHFALAHFDDALECFEACLQLRVGDGGNGDFTSHPNALEIAKHFNNIGVVNFIRGDLVRAAHHLKNALQLQKAWMNGSIMRESLIFDTTVLLGNVGKAYLECSDYDLSLFMFEEALMIQSTYLNKDSRARWENMGNAAFVKFKAGDEGEALKIYETIHKHHLERYGSASYESVEIGGFIGIVLMKCRQYKQAYDHFKQMIEWQQNHLDRNHPALKCTKKHMSNLKSLLNGTIQYSDVREHDLCSI